MIFKCPSATYLALYRSSLSFSDFIARTSLAVIKFVPSGRSVLRIARKVPLLTRSHLSAYLASMISRKFALGSLGLMTSVNRNCGGTANRVSD